jgi:hypothetical protein
MSDINFLGINENFPVPGQDNDTQVFRDNFDTIKQSLRIAGEEITDLQDNVARTDVDNDFNNKIVQRAVFQNTTDKKLDGGNISNVSHTIDYENGSYQIFRFSQDTTIQFQNFPDSNTLPAAVGKITLELYSDGPERTLTFSTSGGTVIKRSANFPSTFIVDSAETSSGGGDPHIIEIWKHGSDRIFLNYLGKFSS